jgi:hypothetical protein
MCFYIICSIKSGGGPKFVTGPGYVSPLSGPAQDNQNEKRQK